MACVFGWIRRVCSNGTLSVEDNEDNTSYHGEDDIGFTEEDFEIIALDSSFDERTLKGLVNENGRKSTRKKRAAIPKFDG